MGLERWFWTWRHLCWSSNGTCWIWYLRRDHLQLDQVRRSRAQEPSTMGSVDVSFLLPDCGYCLHPVHRLQGLPKTWSYVKAWLVSTNYSRMHVLC